MYTIENANGSTYYVMREYRNHDSGENVLLLASYGKKTEDEVQAGASPTQYIVARNWSDKYQCWGSGKYFMCFPGEQEEALKAAIAQFVDSIDF